MPAKDTRRKWNDRWQEKAARDPLQADPWLQRLMPLLAGGNALDIACGRGRNALFLAEHGYRVTGVDISDVALDHLAQAARQRGLDITTQQIDLEKNAALPAGPFDLILNMFYLYRPLLPQILERVRGGGLVVVRTFSCAGAEQFGSAPAEISLREGELLEIFAGWEIHAYEEGLEPSAKGGSLAGIIARSPHT